MYSLYIHIFYIVVIYGTRYRLEVMVNHRDESTKFLLWDRECTKLIGQSADANNRLKIEVRLWIQKQFFCFDMLFFVCIISNTIIVFLCIELFFVLEFKFVVSIFHILSCCSGFALHFQFSVICSLLWHLYSSVLLLCKFEDIIKWVYLTLLSYARKAIEYNLDLSSVDG